MAISGSAANLLQYMRVQKSQNAASAQRLINGYLNAVTPDDPVIQAITEKYPHTSEVYTRTFYTTPGDAANYAPGSDLPPPIQRELAFEVMRRSYWIGTYVSITDDDELYADAKLPSTGGPESAIPSVQELRQSVEYFMTARAFLVLMNAVEGVTQPTIQFPLQLNTADGLPLFHTAHKTSQRPGAPTFSNMVNAKYGFAGSMSPTLDALKSCLRLLRSWTDHENRPTKINISGIITNPIDKIDWMRTYGATNEPGSNRNDLNGIPFVVPNGTPLVSTRLPFTASFPTWILTTDFLTGSSREIAAFMHTVRKEPYLKLADALSSDTQVKRLYIRAVADISAPMDPKGFISPRAVYS